jgi:hypothetical protein
MDFLKENSTVVYAAIGVALVLLIGFLYKRRTGDTGSKRGRGRREGFQAEGGTPTSTEYFIDKNVVCPVLLDSLNTQMKQREVIINLPVDITKTPEFEQINQMIRLSHKNMVDTQCPNIPALPAM